MLQVDFKTPLAGTNVLQSWISLHEFHEKQPDMNLNFQCVWTGASATKTIADCGTNDLAVLAYGKTASNVVGN